MPMSAITMSPARVSAGGSTSGIFGAASVTVRPASIDGPIGSAESADRPDGRSIATTGIPEAFTSVTTDSMNPEIGALRPVPKMASTISVQSLTSEKCSSQAWLSAISTTVRPSRPRISRLILASPRTSATRPIRNTETSTPRCTSVRAMTNPSPPLLPRPQRTAICRSSKSPYIASIAATVWRPAFSMRTSEGMPMSSTVRRSASRICAVLRTLIYELYSPAMAATVNVNGRVSDQEHAVISIFDHGFLYGEGVYETLRTYNGQPFLFDRHMRRLRNSAGMLTLGVPVTDDQLEARCRETMRVAGLGDGANREAYIRILVTRGIGELTYDPAATPASSVIVIVKPNVDPPQEVFERGVKVSLVGVVRNHPGSVNPLIKSNSLLNNALAMQEALRSGAFEGVMRNYKGELAECTQSNLFIVKDGAALTPPLGAGLLPGITREFLFEVGAEIGIPVREAVLHDDDLLGADESFLTSTTREVVPIVQVDAARVGSGKPGPVTQALLEGYRRKANTLTVSQSTLS